jgi:hypothetical protein
MDKNILLGIGVVFFAALFFFLRRLILKSNKGYDERINQIISSEEHKVKGQFGR